MGEEHFLIDQINELLVVLYTSGGDNNSVGSEKSILEVLYDVSCEVGDVALVSVEFVSKPTLSKSSAVNYIVEGLISSKVSIEQVTFFVFMNTNTG